MCLYMCFMCLYELIYVISHIVGFCGAAPVIRQRYASNIRKSWWSIASIYIFQFII